MLLLDIFEAAFPDHKFDWKLNGTNALGFCPLHQDRHQKSLSIFQDAKGRERWHCFAEDIGGGAIALLKQTGIEGTETVEGCNLWLVKNGFRQESELEMKNREHNEALTAFWRWTNRMLREDKEAEGIRAYLSSRHIDMGTLKNAPIGFYPSIPKVDAWLATNGLTEKIREDVIPAEHKSDPIVTGSIIFFYRHSYTEFSRLKVRNVLKEKNGKIVAYLGKKQGKTESKGYFTWSMRAPAPGDAAIIVEGEFDVGALASLIYREDDSAIEPIYSFGGGTSINSGVDLLKQMGVENLYLMPDNDKAGMDYAYSLAEQHPATFIIIPPNYPEDSDPASWAADHTFDDLQTALEGRTAAFAWIGSKLAGMIATATLEERVALQGKLMEYAKKLSATDREVFVRGYSDVLDVSAEAVLDEIQNTSEIKYRTQVTSDDKTFGVYMREGKGKGEWERICNMIPEIQEDVLSPGSGAGEPGEQGCKVKIKFTAAFAIYNTEFAIEEFVDDKKFYTALSKFVGSKLWVKPHAISLVRDAALLLSKSAADREDTSIVPSTGWYDGKYYVPGCYIDEEGYHPLPLSVLRLPPTPIYMNNYHLDEPPADISSIRKIIREDLLQVFPYTVTLPFLAHMAWTVLAAWLPEAKPVCLWVVGLTGTFKTTYSGLMASFFGNFRSCDFETWRSTNNFVEVNGYHPKDLPYIIDDFKGVDIKLSFVTSVIQNYGDRHGRGRLRSDMTSRPTWYIRGNMISTAEDVPRGEASVLARLLILRIPGSGDSAHLTAAQKNAKFFPGVMSKFIHYICTQKARLRALEDTLIDRRTRFNTGHGRVNEALATNSIAWDFIADFLDLHDLDEEYDKALSVIVKDMAATTKEEKASAIFIDMVKTLLESGKFYLKGVRGMRDTFSDERGEHIGWLAPDAVYLMGNAAFAEANRLHQAITGTGIKYSLNTIYEQLKSENLIIPDKSGRSTTSQRFDGRQVRVVEFKRGVLEEYETLINTEKPHSAVIRNSKAAPGLEEQRHKNA